MVSGNFYYKITDVSYLLNENKARLMLKINYDNMKKRLILQTAGYLNPPILYKILNEISVPGLFIYLFN